MAVNVGNGTSQTLADCVDAIANDKQLRYTRQQGEQDSHLCALLPCICRRAFCHQHMSSVVVQTQIMDSHPSTTRHISVRQTLFCQYCNLGMGQCPAQAVAAPMHALNMRAAHVTLHASMHVKYGIMCVLTLRECWHCTDHCIVWPESGVAGRQVSQASMQQGAWLTMSI